MKLEFEFRNEIADLERQLAEKQVEIDAMRPVVDKYNALLYAVATKFSGETRHETALRYITNAERSKDGPAQESRKQP